VNLTTPESVQKLQTTLHTKAKESPEYRFYSLYDKVYRADILAYAYECCRANGGAAGVDEQRFEDIESKGLENWLGELAKELRDKTYRPEVVRRVYIPKPNGSKRPLGIPTIRDRVAQMATVLVLEPIFEADLEPEQYAYRRERSALDAVKKVHSLLNTGHREVIDADLSGYFDNIPHAELMKSLARRISDGHLLHLIKMWLEAAVEEIDERGKKRRTTRNKDEGKGTPQGAPISPLLSNLYMRRFVLGWRVLGHAERLKAQIVNYADDFVICCRGTAQEAMSVMRAMMKKLRLTVNEDKTHVCRVPDESFDFLGYTIGRCWSKRTGQPYIGTRPSKKRIARICDAISEITGRRWLLMDTEERVARLNSMMIGWANYFRLGSVSKAYRAVDAHTRYRLRQWLRAKHKVRGAGTGHFPDEYLYDTLGLVELARRTRDFPWAKRMSPCPRAGCGRSARPVR
jgi:group II intron reverse transcriptase/maturase